MKIKMITLKAGPAGVFPPGTVLDLEAGEAKALIDGGFAAQCVPDEVEKPAPAEVEETPPVEVASIEAPEKAVSRAGSKGHRRK